MQEYSDISTTFFLSKPKPAPSLLMRTYIYIYICNTPGIYIFIHTYCCRSVKASFGLIILVLALGGDQSKGQSQLVSYLCNAAAVALT